MGDGESKGDQSQIAVRVRVVCAITQPTRRVTRLGRRDASPFAPAAITGGRSSLRMAAASSECFQFSDISRRIRKLHKREYIVYSLHSWYYTFCMYIICPAVTRPPSIPMTSAPTGTQSRLHPLRHVSMSLVADLNSPPIQKIRTEEDVHVWKTTTGYRDYGLFLRRLTESVVGYSLPWSSQSPSTVRRRSISLASMPL